MKKFNKTILASIFALATYGTVEAAPWTVTRSWNGGVHGQRVPLGRGDNFNLKEYTVNGVNVAESYFDNTRSRSGGMSVRQRHATNQNDGDQVIAWVGVESAGPGYLSEGEEFWAQAWIYVPADFYDPGTSKLFRLFTGSAAKRGIDIIVNGDGKSGNPYTIVVQPTGFYGGQSDYYFDVNYGAAGGSIFHTKPALYADDSRSTATLAKGQWNLIEMYVKASTNPAVGKIRLWMYNDSMGTKLPYLVYDITRDTMTGTAQPQQSAIGVQNGPVLTIWDQWGNRTTTYHNSDTWLDDVIMTNDPTKATQTDAAGNKMIGTREDSISAGTGSDPSTNSNPNAETSSMHLHVCRSIELCNPANNDNISNCEVACESLKFQDERQQWRNT